MPPQTPVDPFADYLEGLRKRQKEQDAAPQGQPTDLGQWLDSHKQPTRAENNPPLSTVRGLSTFETLTDMVKGVGLAVTRELTGIPAGLAGLADIMDRHNMGQAIFPEVRAALNASRSINKEASKELAQTSAALKSGAFSPQEQAELRSRGHLLAGPNLKYTGSLMPAVSAFAKYMPDIVAESPSMTGSVAGSLAPGMVEYEAAAGLTKVAMAKSLTQRVLRSGVANAIATAVQSALIDPVDGESRWARVLKDVALNTAFEVIQFPAAKAAWKDELGKKAADKLTREMAEAAQLHPDVADAKIAAVRMGAGHMEPEFAEKVLMRSPPGSPLEYQSRKALDAYWNDIVPKSNAVIPGQEGITMDIIVNGQVVMPDFTITKSTPTAPRGFADQVDQLAEQIVAMSEQGIPVRLDRIRVGNGAAYTRFMRRLRGEPAQYGAMDARELHEFEQKLVGTAPRNTVAEHGNMPAAGTHVTVKDGDKPAWNGTVVDKPGVVPPAPGGEVPRNVGPNEAEQRRSLSAAFTAEDKGIAALTPNRVKARFGMTASDAVRAGYVTAHEEGGRVVYRIVPKGAAVERPVLRTEGARQPEAPIEEPRGAGAVEEPPLEELDSRGRPITATRSAQPKGEYPAVVVQQESARTAEPGARAGGTTPTATPAPGRVAEAPRRPDPVYVENPVTGQVVEAPQTSVRVFLKETKAPTKLKAHTDGTDRHFYIELNSKTALIEGVDQHHDPQNDWHRSHMFSDIDREGDLMNGPRGFIHEDGSITLSLTRGERFTTYTSGLETTPSRRDWVGEPSDREKYSTEVRTMQERSAHNEGIGSTTHQMSGTTPRRELGLPPLRNARGEDIPEVISYTYESGTPPGPRAGVEPKAAQDWAWQYNPITGHYEKSPVNRPTTHRIEAAPEMEPREELPGLTAAARGREYESTTTSELSDEALRKSGRLTPDESKGIDRWRSLEKGRYVISKAPLITDPALMDAKRAADILIKQSGVDPGTKVRLVVTDTVHSGVHNAPHEWTLSELSQAEPGLFSQVEVRAAARTKGYRAVVQGDHTTLIDLESKTETTFASRIEAANFLSKQRNVEITPDIDAQWNTLLNSGWKNSFDPVVDGGSLVQREAQQLGLQAMVDGQRAGIRIWLPTEETLGDLASRAEKAQKRGKLEAVKVLTEEIETSSRLQSAINALEQKLGVRPGTIRAMNLGVTQGVEKDKAWFKKNKSGKITKVEKTRGRTESVVQEEGKQQVLVYNDDKVRELRKQYGSKLGKLLKISNLNNHEFIRDLAGRPGGLDLLQHPDPESAIVYMQLKNTHQHDVMMGGVPMDDPATGRAYRHYTDEQKAAYFEEAATRVKQKGGTPCSPVVR